MHLGRPFWRKGGRRRYWSYH